MTRRRHHATTPPSTPQLPDGAPFLDRPRYRNLIEAQTSGPDGLLHESVMVALLPRIEQLLAPDRIVVVLHGPHAQVDDPTDPCEVVWREHGTWHRCTLLASARPHSGHWCSNDADLCGAAHADAL